jgi:azurin
MIVAQGDRRNGYGLYFLDNKLYFTINQDGKAYNLTNTEPLPRKFSFAAGLQENGEMKLKIDDKEIGSQQTQGLFSKQPELPLRTSFEIRKGAEKIGNYPDTFLLSRSIALDNAKLEILDRSVSTSTTITGPVAQVIELNTVKDIMKYDKELITAKAGTVIQIVLNNPDHMQHNLVLIKPNTTEIIGAAADQLTQDPNGAAMNYVPRMSEVLAATPLIDPGESYTLTIKVPDIPGDYPYICTFPGHWRIMNGILRVTK